jgi:light-regulated signal transduction histidine kinase (bacteriophytochrome)
LSSPQSEFDKFVYAVSHDLQEPLRGVSAFLKLLDQKYSDQLDEQAQTYINFTLENAEKMRQMIYALVDLSRVSRNNEEKEVINMNELAANVWLMYNNAPAASGASFIAEDLPQIKGISTQLVQLMQVLFQNSVDNKSEKPLEIHFDCKEEKDLYKFSFADNGKGIPEAYQDSIFEIFRKADPKSGKAGAGLTIARAIVEKHGGKISLTSIEDQGTTVYFTWPKESS